MRFLASCPLWVYLQNKPQQPCSALSTFNYFESLWDLILRWKRSISIHCIGKVFFFFKAALWSWTSVITEHATGTCYCIITLTAYHFKCRLCKIWLDFSFNTDLPGEKSVRTHTHRFGYISHLDINKICHFYEGVQFLLFWRHFETQILEYFIWLCYGEMLIFYYHIIYITGFTQKYTKKLKSKRCSYFRAVRENSMIAHLWFICDTASIYISYSLQNAFVFKQGFEQLHVTFQMNLKQLE